MPFSTLDNNLKRAANALLVVNVALFGYAYYLLEAKSKTLTGQGGFGIGTDLLLPALWFGMGVAEWRSRNALFYSVLCLVMLLFVFGIPLHVPWLSTTAWILTAAMLVVPVGYKVAHLSRSDTDV